jgi:hypothetical protein
MTDEMFELVMLDYWNIPVEDKNDLYSKVLVSGNYGDEVQERVQKEIIALYFKIWGLTGRVPFLYEVYDDAIEFNDNIFTQIAAIEIAQENDISMLTEGKFGELIEERRLCFEEMYSQFDSAYLDYFVANTLDQYKMAYMTDSEDFLYDDIHAEIMTSKMKALNKNANIIVNDAQNIMFECFLEEGFTTSCGDLIYIKPNQNALVDPYGR